MNSYELQQLYIKKRENKTTTKHGQTNTKTTTPNQHKQGLVFVVGSLVSRAFAGLLFVLWLRKQEKRFSELQGRVKDLEGQ